MPLTAGLAVALATLSVGLQAAPASAAPASRRLVVVIWERRAPDDEASFETRLTANRAALLELLYGSERPLVGGEAARTVLAVYPEGLPAAANASALYQTIRSASAAEVLQFGVPQMVVTPEAVRGPTGLFYAPAPARDRFDRDLERRVTTPLLRLPEPTADGQPSGRRRPNPAFTRAWSCPPLVTPWAIHDAARRAGAGPPFTEAYVVWVQAGDRNYEVTSPEPGIRRDLGAGARELFVAGLDLFVLASDNSWRSTRGTAGRLSVHRVLDARTYQSPPSLAIRDGEAPAALHFKARWRRMPLPGDLFPSGEAASPLRTFDDLPAVRWKAVIPVPGYRLEPGAFRWEGGELASGMGADGAMRLDMKSAILGRATPHEDLAEDLVAEALAIPEPPASGQLAPYLQPLWVPIATPVRAQARVRVEVDPIERWVYALVALVALALAVGVALYRRPRELHLEVQWPAAVDFVLARPQDSLTIPVRVLVHDRSGLPRRSAALTVSLAIDRIATGLPLSGGVPLCSVSPRTLALSRPHRRRGGPLPVEVRLSGGAVDLRKVTAGGRFHAALVLSVTVGDARQRYRSASLASPFLFDVSIAAAEADLGNLLAVEAVSPIRERGLYYAPGPTSKPILVGSMELHNRAPGGLVAPDVTAKVTMVSLGTAAGKSPVRLRAQAQLRAVGKLDPDAIMLRNGDRARFDVYLLVEPGAVPPGVERCDVVIRIAVEARRSDDASGWTRSHRKFGFEWHLFVPTRHVCLDLGTSAVRLLRDGGAYDPDRWGYALFDRPPINEPRLNERWPGEDLPSYALFTGNGSPHIGHDAVRLMYQKDARFLLSIKDVMIDDLEARQQELSAYVDELLRKYYVPLTRQTTVVRCPDPSAELQILAGDAEVLVASIPNALSARYRAAYQTALQRGPFRTVSLLREAEAVAIWYSSWSRHRAPQRGKAPAFVADTSGPGEILIVDVGAGTTDVALAQVEDPGGLQGPRVRIRSLGSAALAGRSVDRAVLDELARTGWFAAEAQARYSERERLEIAEGVKIAIAERQPQFEFLDTAEFFRIDLDRGKLAAIAASPGYRRAIAEIAEASLSVLLGRLPPDVRLDAPRNLVLTGRGARILDLQAAILTYLDSHGMSAVTVAEVPPQLLKASVTMGCRAYARHYWSEIKHSTDASLDRMLLVYRGEADVGVVEMLPVETPIGQAGPWVPIPQWRDAKLIATHLRTDHDIADPQLRLDTSGAIEILEGRLHPRPHWHPPYSLLRGPSGLPRSDERRRVEARIVLRSDGIELEHRYV